MQQPNQQSLFNKISLRTFALLAACIGVFPSVEPPYLLRSFSASVSLPLPFRQPSSGIQRLCCIKLALLLHIFLGFFKRMENAHRHTLVPQFGFRYKPTKVYSLCLLRIFLTLFSNFLTNSNFFVAILKVNITIISLSMRSSVLLVNGIALLCFVCSFVCSLLLLCLRYLACSASLRAVFGSACASFSVAAVLSSAVGSFSFSSLYIVFSIPTKSLPSLQKDIATCSKHPNNHHITKSRVAFRATLLPLLTPNKTQAKTTAFLGIPNGNYQQTTNTHTASHKASGAILRHILAHFNTA